jgi:predicted nucleotidyltransferase
MMNVKTKLNRNKLIKYYLERIVQEFKPHRVYLTGSAVSQNMPETSDFDFIVDSDIPIDADTIVGNLDIIPVKHATDEMLQKAILIYSTDLKPA